MAKEFVEKEKNGKDDLQIDQIPKTYLLIEKYWSVLDKNLPRYLPTLMKFIGHYRSNNVDSLATPYPTNYPVWSDMCVAIIYRCCGIDEEEFKKDVLTIRGYNGYIDTHLVDKSPYVLLNMIVRWMVLNKKEDTVEMQILCTYMGIAHYWSVFTDIFKRFKPKLEAMRYTINNMSYKGSIKALGSVEKWLLDSVEKAYDTYRERLLRGSDWELHYINEKIRGKLKSAIKTIYAAHAKTLEEKKYIYDSESVLSDNIIDNTYGVSEIAALGEKYAMRFFNNPVEESCISSVMTKEGLSAKDLKNTLLKLADDVKNRKDVIEFYQSLFNIFLSDEKNTVGMLGTMKFFHIMENAYKPGNTVNQDKIIVKDYLDKWLDSGSATYHKTSRTPTKTNFRKTLYNYFLFKVIFDKNK